MSVRQIIEADLTWTGRHFESGIQVVVDDHGRIEAIGPDSSRPTRRLVAQALLPGFVNAHSHAFQRGLRGHHERFPDGPGSFWTWRRAMYQLVEGLDPDRFLALSTQAFREMRASGITTVGEFHYIHHTTGTHDFLYDRLILDAAREAGIRIVLLVAFYRTGGIGKPLNQAQRRCETVAPDVYWDHLDALASHLNPEQTLGTVVHSIRATGLDDLAAVHARSLRRDLPFHIHLEEQRREIEECAAAYGRTPMRVLLDTIETARNVTGVHCTHTTPADRLAFLDAGGRACICPLTEANLGDGLPDLEGVPHGQLCLGTDSNARIDMWEEMRWLEYGQRLRHELRGVLREPGGQVARTALEIATASGAAALGVETGRMAPGAWADFSAVSLEAPALRWAEPEHLLETLMSGADGGAVVSTCVGGLWEKHRLL